MSTQIRNLTHGPYTVRIYHHAGRFYARIYRGEEGVWFSSQFSSADDAERAALAWLRHKPTGETP